MTDRKPTPTLKAPGALPVSPATETAVSERGAQLWALAVCREFISDWSRVSSIIGWMEEAVAVEVDRNPEGSTWIPETFAANTYWLRERLEEKAAAARKSLGDAGFTCGPLI
jgi:hypothetical protein